MLRMWLRKVIMRLGNFPQTKKEKLNFRKKITYFAVETGSEHQISRRGIANKNESYYFTYTKN